MHIHNPYTIILRALQICLLCVLIMIVSVARAGDFLEPEQAFKLSVTKSTASSLELRFIIADGYYLYRERFKFEAQGVALGSPVIPAGKIKFDETFQKNVETYHQGVLITIPVQTDQAFSIKISYQGCADQGLCYSPMTSEFVVPAGLGEVSLAPTDNAQKANDTVAKAQAQSIGDFFNIGASLKSGRLSAIIPLFLLLGLGLSLTPCVLPMVPILSFIIVGEGAAIQRGRGFLLSLCYVLGMALVYTALGVTAGLIGEGLSASLQKPAVLVSFALLMVVLSLSMFGLYQLQVPSVLQTKLTFFSEGQRNGKLLGVFLMGAISALIVGPCVAAPLAGALVYISQTRDVLVGGVALFSLAMGMGVPLLMVGLSAGSLLPRAGMWMEAIKRFFGVLMLAMAWWMVNPLLSVSVQMLGWGLLAIAYAVYLVFTHRRSWLAMSFALALGLLGTAQFVGGLTGSRSITMPLAHLLGQQEHMTPFVRVKSIQELDEALMQSKGKLALLDFYADWCVSCKEMEKFTFTNPQVKEKFDQMLLLQVDVTANNADDKALLKRFGLFGPPGIILFDSKGQEIDGARIIGYQNAETFLKSLESTQ